MNILYKTKVYLVGQMQYKNGENWRNKITPFLKSMNVTVFNPYDKPYLKDVQETQKTNEDINILMNSKKYDDVQKIMREIRVYDLNMVDRSDFIIAYIDPSIPTFGTTEELTVAVRMKKPTFIFIESGKKNCPHWIMGMFPHKYIYNTMNDIINILTQIDSGNKKIDSDRWRLLREEFR